MNTREMQVLSKHLPEFAMCAVCRRPPKSVVVEQSPTDGIRVRAACHGVFGIIDISSEELAGTFGQRGKLPDLTFFRRNWSEFKRPTVRELLEARR